MGLLYTLHAHKLGFLKFKISCTKTIFYEIMTLDGISTSFSEKMRTFG